MPGRHRRSNGEGTWRERVRTLPSGTVKKDWLYTVSLGIDPMTGRRMRQTFYGATKSEVRLKHERWRSKLGGGSGRRSAAITVEEFLNAWIDDVGRSRANSTKTFYEHRIRRFVLPEEGSWIGRMQLRDLENEHIEKLYRQLDVKGISADNVQKLHKTLRRAFNVAIGKGLIVTNPCAHVERRPHRTAKRVSLSAAQVAVFFAAIAGSRYEAFYRLGILATMRPGEIFGLEWSDIDLDAGIVDVQRTIEESYPRTVGPVKADSARKIPLEAETIAVLRRHHAAMTAEKHGTGYLFVTKRDGIPVPPPRVRSDLNAICKAAGLPKLALYNLRHTGVSLFGEAGVSIRVIGDIAGHADPSMTIDVYSHATSEMQRAAVEQAAALVKAATKAA